jgi:hypothetical protein
VAGNDPEKAEAFKRLREAYEVLSDPSERARYDRRGQPRAGGPFYGSMWNRGNVNVGAGQSTPPTRAAGNDLDLEDIFNDFSGVGDFGFTGNTRGQGTGRFKGSPVGSGTAGGRAPSGARPGAAPPRPPPSASARPEGPSARPPGRDEPPSAGGRPEATSPPRGARRPSQAGRDIPASVDVPPHIAASGGTVTVTYTRLRRADDGHTLYRYDELYDLRVPPGTRHGETLRVERMGDAGLEGGPFGDLVVDVQVTGGRGEARSTTWDPAPNDPWDAAVGGAPTADPSSWTAGGPGVGRRRPPDGARVRAWQPGGWSRPGEGEGPPVGGHTTADAPHADGPGGGRGVGAEQSETWDARAGGGGAEPTGARDARSAGGRMRMPGHEPTTTADGALRVDVSVVTALLGGPVTVPTPAGPVRVNVPAGTSSGTRMRLRGRGPAGPDGVAGDLVAEIRIVVPRQLDAESRALIERFAELNRTEE